MIEKGLYIFSFFIFIYICYKNKIIFLRSINWSQYKNFSSREFECNCNFDDCEKLGCKEELIEKEDDVPDNGNNNTSGSILGTWEYNGDRLSIHGYIDPISNQEIITYSDSWTHGLNNGEYLTFLNNDTCIYLDTTDEVGNIKFLYTKNGNIITFTELLQIGPSNWILGTDEFTLTITQQTNTEINYDYFHEEYTNSDTVFVSRVTGSGNLIKSNLPPITNMNVYKNKFISGYKSFSKIKK